MSISEHDPDGIPLDEDRLRCLGDLLDLLEDALYDDHVVDVVVTRPVL